jgi:hypothetical protein
VENWRNVPDWPEYQVSDLGRVRRVSRSKRGRGRADGILAQADRNGYRVITLFRRTPDQIIKLSAYVHRMVLLSFAGSPPAEGMQCNHKNGVRHDNALANLEWTTSLENNQHAVHDLGAKRGTSGIGCSAAKVVDCQAIRQASADGLGERRIAKQFNVSRWLVREVLAGSHWSQRETGDVS